MSYFIVVNTKSLDTGSNMLIEFIFTVLLQACSLHRAFLFLINRQALVQHCNEFLLSSLKVIIRTIDCLAPVIDCKTFLRRRLRLNAGRVSDGALGRDYWSKRGENTLYVEMVSNNFLSACACCLTNTMK
jgi:hypothetical protein